MRIALRKYFPEGDFCIQSGTNRRFVLLFHLFKFNILRVAVARATAVGAG